MVSTNLTSKRRMKWMIMIAFLLFTLLLIRIAWIEFVQGGELQAMAYAQQVLNRKINPKRGTIYDATGENMLAVSSSVETVSINPMNIEEEKKEFVAQKLSELFELDYEKTLKKVRNSLKYTFLVQFFV